MKKKRLSALLLALLVTVISMPFAYAEPENEQNADIIYLENDQLTSPDTSNSEAAVLMDLKSGRYLYAKNGDRRLYPASTTKIMTGILALELGNMSDTVTASYQALESITLEDSHMGILIGEELTMEQLVTGMMVYSANDAANVIAIHIAGSIENFVNLMNQKAQELGMLNTHFTNACGIHDDNHYTSASDLAILTKYAMQNEKFKEIVRMPIYKIAPTNKYTSERILVNTNLFLGTSRSTYYYYPPAIGVKTGHTSKAGYCLVSAATYNNNDLLAVVMNCQNTDEKEHAYSYIDSKSMFDFGFDNYLYQQVALPGENISQAAVYEAKDNTVLNLAVEQEVAALLPSALDNTQDIVPNINIPDTLAAPIKQGDVVGTVSYTYKGTAIGTTNLIAANDVDRNELLHICHIIIKVITSPFFYIPAILIIIVAVISINQRKKRKRQRRLKQLRRNRTQGISNELGRYTPDRNASRIEKQSNETRSQNSMYNNNDSDND